ncbi:hypothetical protein [Paenibacillus selenitireducens]|uniref:hypothetical protein n=1 Tax=Paenibacillus selenitireducens TaxID=1324314 RepID=UPI0013020B10|nr:hypothetical protein [Paenibacillus selenitireducens]
MLHFDWIYSYIWQSGTWVEDMIDPMLLKITGFIFVLAQLIVSAISTGAVL